MRGEEDGEWRLEQSPVTDFTGYSQKNNRFEREPEWNCAGGENAESAFNGVTPLKLQYRGQRVARGVAAGVL